MNNKALARLASTATHTDITYVGRKFRMLIDGSYGLSDRERQVNREGGRIIAYSQNELVAFCLQKSVIGPAREHATECELVEIEEAINKMEKFRQSLHIGEE